MEIGVDLGKGKDKTVWVIMRNLPDNEMKWELNGIFELEEEARKYCKDEFDGIAEIELNKFLGYETITPESFYRPKEQ